MGEPAHLSRRAIAAALPLAALAGASTLATAALPATPQAGGDAALLDLGWRWLAAWATLREHDLFVEALPDDDDAAHSAQDVIADRLFAAEQRLFDDILAMPVRTLQGLALKAQVVARAHDAREPGIAPIETELARERTDLETHAALTLALDILKLAREAS